MDAYSANENAPGRGERRGAGSEQTQHNSGSEYSRSGPAGVSNISFLRTICSGHLGKPWTTAFATDPHKATAGEWAGRQALNAGDVPRGAGNSYFCVATFAEGATRRLKDDAQSVLVVVLDDIGTDDLDALPPPTWVVETSPHNNQVGYALAPGEDRAEVEALLRALTGAGRKVADRSGNSIARYVRLPQGINSKATVIDECGCPFPVRLAAWEPERRFRVAVLAAAFGVDLEAPQEAGERARNAETDAELREAIVSCTAFHDPLVKLAARLVGRGMDARDAQAVLQSLMTAAADNLPDSTRRRDWEARMAEIPRLVATAAAKFRDSRAPREPPRGPSETAPAIVPPPAESLRATEDELAAAHLTPGCIVRDHTYADVAQIAGPGGSGKTTLLIAEAVHTAIGRPLYGLAVESPGWTLFISAEDQRSRLLARLREVLADMELTPEERAAAIAGFRVWDVSGEAVKLIRAKDGNMELTGLADSIVATYKDDPPVVVVFDPLVSFGASEQAVNDNEQALVTAARRIVKGLGCCVRLIHHVGKANARAATLDQYSGRGGSALADGSRMTTVLQPWMPDTPGGLTPPPGCALEPGATITVMERAKLSFCPPLPRIWIRRRGFAFEHFSEPPRQSPAEVRSAQADQIERWLASQLAAGRYHSARSVEDHSDDIGMPQKGIRRALAELTASGRVVTRPLPKDRCQGGRKTYLAPAHCGNGFAAVAAEEGSSDDPTAAPPTTAAPYKGKNVAAVATATFSPPSLHCGNEPCRSSPQLPQYPRWVPARHNGSDLDWVVVAPSDMPPDGRDDANMAVVEL